MSKIGDIVKVKIWREPPNGWLHLVERKAMLPPTESECRFEMMQIIGCYQMSSDDFIALCDFDPFSYISFKLNSFHQKGYDVADKYLSMRAAYISSDHIWLAQAQAPVQQLTLHTPGGMACKLCKKFIQYAGVNRDDGTFACKRCRETRGYLLKCKPIKT